jgi:dTDP-4-dehydrorhamnose reductase
VRLKITLKKENMKIILLGKNGMLGSMIHFLASRQGIDIVALGRSQFDALIHPVQVLESFIQNQQCCVINCIGAIPQKKPSDEVYKALNEIFPQTLAAFCTSHNIPLIHISTNCVFSGNQADMTETHNPDAKDIYGNTKARGEPKDAVVLRCSIIGFERAGSQFGLLEWYCGESQAVRGYKDHYWNGLTTHTLATTILEIINKRQFTPRLEHHYSENTLSKYDILCELSKYLKDSAPIIGIEAGIRHYTLKSIYEHTKHTTIESQLADMFALHDDYKMHSIIENIGFNPAVYQKALPFPHGVCDNVLNAEFAAGLLAEIKGLGDSAWDRYENPFEKKYTLRDKYSFPLHLRALFDVFQSPVFVKSISHITRHDLVLDTTRNFWGVHKYKVGDKLDIHVDAGFHPTLGLKKQVTLGLYLSQSWEEDDGCALELWKGSSAGAPNPQLVKCVKSILPLYNRMVLFDCNDVAWHGNPDPCRKDGRIFITISYLSHETDYENKKVKALFAKRPEDPEDPDKDRLRLQRADPELYKTIYRV